MSFNPFKRVLALSLKFISRQNPHSITAKGSHTRWYHELLPQDPITISGKDGDDAQKYLEKQINQKLAKLKRIQQQ